MSVRDSQIVSVVSTTMLRLISKASRGRSGGLRLSSNDKWRVLIVVLYLLVVMLEATQSK